MNEEITELAPEKAEPTETDEQAKVDATRAEIAAQGTEEVVEEVVEATEAELTTDPEAGDGEKEKSEVEAGENTKSVSKARRERRKTLQEAQKAESEAKSAKITELERKIDEFNKKADTPPNEDDFPGDYEAYLGALGKFEQNENIDRRFVERDKQEIVRLEKEEEKAAELHRENLFKDFPGLRGSVAEINNEVGDLNKSFQGALSDSPKYPEIVRYLGQNIEECERLNSMGHNDISIEVRNLEVQLSVPKPKKTISTAPSPVTPVKGGTAPPLSSLAKLAASGDMKAYARARKAEMTS